MYLIGRFAPRKTILWHAGASSVSISGIQLSRGDNAAAVFATVRSDDSYAVRTRIPAGRRAGGYSITARCGGGSFGVSAQLHVQ